MSSLSKKMKARRVADMSTAQLMRRAAAYQSKRPAYRLRQATYGRSSGETKGVDVSLSLSPIISTSTTNASSFLLNAIAPGNGSFNRIGRKAHLKSLRIKGGIIFAYTPDAGGAVAPNSVRMVVVWDQQPNSGSIPTWDTIFGITAQDGTESSNVSAPLRYDNMDRFKVIKDRHIDCQTVPGNVAGTAVVQQYVSVDDYVSLNLHSLYSGQSAPCTTADISTGALYVFFRAQTNGATASAIVDPDTIARLRYTD